MFRIPLKCVEVGVAAFALLFLALPVTAEEWKQYRQSASHMGTKWHIALYSRTPEAANTAFERAWKLIGEIDSTLTNYSADSELNLLCNGAPHEAPVRVGEHLWTVMSAANALSKETDGAFDVTIGPVSKLWRRARKRKQMPDLEKLARARELVGAGFVRLVPETKSIQLLKPRMQIDLGGIAKGYAVDQAIEAITTAGIESALVNGGGDLRVSGSPPDKEAWTVEVANLMSDSRTPSRTPLVHAAIATSGDAWQFVLIDGKRYSHIIDPKTGLGVTRRTATTVRAPTCMQADALASVICVLTPEKGMQLADTKKNVAAQIVLATDTEVRSWNSHRWQWSTTQQTVSGKRLPPTKREPGSQSSDN